MLDDLFNLQQKHFHPMHAPYIQAWIIQAHIHRYIHRYIHHVRTYVKILAFNGGGRGGAVYTVETINTQIYLTLYSINKQLQ